MDSDIEDTEETPTFEPTVSLVSNRVSIRQLPYLDVFNIHTHIRLTIDFGATGNMIRSSSSLVWMKRSPPHTSQPTNQMVAYL